MIQHCPPDDRRDTKPLTHASGFQREIDTITVPAWSDISVALSVSILLLLVAACRPAAEQALLLKDAAMVVTMDPALGRGDLGIIENGDVLIIGDRIARVGRNLTVASAEVLDVSGRIVLPGFVDVHNHLWQTLVRGCGTNDNLYQWLAACQFPLYEVPISANVAYAGARLGTLDLINSGITTTVDWVAGPSPEFIRGNLGALEDSGLRFIFAYFGTTVDETTIKDIENVKRRLDKNPLGGFQVGAHAIDKEPFRSGFFALAKLSQKLGVKLHVHLRENIGDREAGQLELLEQAQVIGPQLQVAHAIHLDDSEIAMLAERRVHIAHSPLSNMRLASGIMRLPDMMQAGMRIGLGLDGGTSDMFNTMRVAVGLQRALSLRPDVRPSVSEVLQLATIGGARVLDMEQRIGSLTPGKQADLIVLDPATTNFAPRFDWVSQIVFNAQPANVEWVIVNGRVLKRRGELVAADVDEIIARADRAVDTIKEILEKTAAARASTEAVKRETVSR